MAFNETKALKEIDSLKKKASMKPRWYHTFLISFFFLCLAYVIDEIATNTNSIIEVDVLNTFFNSEKGFNDFLLVTTLCSGIAFFTFFYKALADRFGRKIFLVINTIGIAIGMFVCFSSHHVVLYCIGLIIMYFFTPCDIQVVYILETASPKRRAFFLSISKAIGTLGIILVPSLHDWACSLGENTWNFVFLIPACIGVLTGILCLFFVRESPLFIESRISILEDKIKNKDKPLSKEKKLDDAEGGIISAIKYMFKHKVLLWLFVIVIFFSLCAIMTSYSGFMIDDEIENYYLAFTLYPIVTAVLQVTIGYLADLLGRKKGCLIAAILGFTGGILFTHGCNHYFHPAVLGISLGMFVAGYISSLDMANVICSEESPTNLRSSIMSLMGVAQSIGSFLPVGILYIVGLVTDSINLVVYILCIIGPALLVGIILLLVFVPETYHNSLSNIFKKKKENK